jgi:tetratricopeptide (TPR) repeat protein
VGTHESSEADRLLAQAELRSGNLDAAAAAIDRALELAPVSVEAHRLRARIRYEAGQFADALEGFQTVARLVRLSLEERLLVARCLYETGDPAAGRRLLETLAASDPPYVPAALELARREAKADPEAAERALAQAEAAAPRAPAVLHQRTLHDLRAGDAARALARLDGAAVALVHFQRATTLAEEAGASRAIHYYHLGLAHRAASQNRSAVAAFDRALALEPEFPEAQRAREERAQALAGGAPTSSPPRP